MCWFSAEYATRVEAAKAGQRLGIKRAYNHTNWVVLESELEARWPTPVCLLDRTRVLFRFSEDQEQRLRLGPEAEAGFRMLKRPKRDGFDFMGGKQLSWGGLPADVIFDVLVVSGSEQDSALFATEPAVEDEGGE